MKVQQLMTRRVCTCSPGDSLERAAQLLWENDCGVLPVVDETGQVDAVITDRDICMGAYTRGKCLAELKVADSMVREVATCRADDDAGVAAQRMIDHRVRRLPVVDDKGRLQGIVALGDLAREGSRDKELAHTAARVLASVTKPRAARPAAARKAERADVLLAGRVEQEC